MARKRERPARALTARGVLESVLQTGVDKARELESSEPLTRWESGYRLALYDLLNCAYAQIEVIERTQGKCPLNDALRAFDPNSLLRLESMLAEGAGTRSDDRLAFALMARVMRDAEAAAEVLRIAAGYLRRGERMPDEIAEHVATAFDAAAMEPASKRARALARLLYIEDLGDG